MRLIKTILRRLRSSAQVNGEIEDELRFHIEMRVRDNLSAGMTREEAEADALHRFGNYQRVKATCCEISSERLVGMNLNSIKGVIWVMFGCGLTLQLSSGIDAVARIGPILMTIAVLWRALLYLRATQPDQQRIRAAEHVPLGITEAAPYPIGIGFPEQPQKQIPVRDERGRTPVERLIDDEESSS